MSTRYIMMSSYILYIMTTYIIHHIMMVYIYIMTLHTYITTVYSHIYMMMRVCTGGLMVTHTTTCMTITDLILIS
jgi:hypothetical protein